MSGGVASSMNITSFGFGSLVIILSAIPAVAEPNLAPIPVNPSGIELSADHPGVHGMLQSIAADPTMHVNLQNDGGLSTAIGNLAPARAGSPSEAATAFVSGRLGLRVAGQQGLTAASGANATTSGDGLAIAKDLESFGQHHVTYRHEVAGIPVHGDEVLVHLGADNRVTAVNGTYRELPANTPAQTISESSAAQRAMAHLGVTTLRAQPVIAREWIAVEGKLALAFTVNVPSAKPLGDFQVAINAETGAVIGGENQLCNASAQAKVYPHSPLDHDMVTTALNDLTDANHLSGAYVNVLNAKDDVAVASNGGFFYDDGDTHFSEVMVFKSLSTVHDYYKTAQGFTGRDKPMSATVHYGDAYDNAFYSPMTDSMSFGDGNKLNNLSLEDNVAFHEYTHGVAHLITGLGGAEGGAMNEADADYFACTITGSPLVGVWAMRKLNRPWMRNLENKFHYPEDIHHEVHADAGIWEGGMWDIRKTLGAQATDKLLFKSWYHLPSRPTFINGLEGLIAADKELNNGANVAKITQIMNARGIKSGNFAPVIAGNRSLNRQAAFLNLVE